MKIIAVDDDRIALEQLKRNIRQVEHDVEIHGFLSSEKALKFAMRQKVDIAFLDIEMPVMNGIELARRLQKHNPDINIIFVTAHWEYSLSAMELHASGYLLKPATPEELEAEMSHLRFPMTKNQKKIRVVTFGHFELLVDGKPVHFKRSKSKEMLACLVDWHGDIVTRKELAATLFEDRAYTRSTQDYLGKIVKELKRALTAVGAEKIFVKSRDGYAVDITQFSCDLYEYENGDVLAKNAFNGKYMVQYSWAEITLGALTQYRK